MNPLCHLFSGEGVPERVTVQNPVSLVRMHAKVHQTDKIYRRELILIHALFQLIDNGKRGIIKRTFINPVLRRYLQLHDKAAAILVRTLNIHADIFFARIFIYVLLWGIL